MKEPRPAKVIRASGLVKFNLVMPNLDPRSGKPDPRMPERYKGVMLAEIVEDRKVRVEIFPGMRDDEVRGFTPSARFYER